ncbi:ATP-binding protein [Deferrisoma sp.]
MRLGITGKFVLLAAGLVVVATAVWGQWTWNRERGLLEERLLQKGRILLSSMSIPVIQALLYEEMGVIEEGGLLDSFLADIMAQEDLAPVYAVVLDPEGRVLAHNEYAEYGRVYRDPVSLRALEARGFLQQPAVHAGVTVWDLAYPLAIHGKSWGVLRVGVSLAPLNEELRELAGQIFGFSAVFSLGALVVFWAVGAGLARPLLRLRAHVEAVGGPEYPEVAPSGRRDEIGDLERAFAEMVGRLRASEAERERATRKLLENERLVAVGQIVAGVAHEVNNPLAAIESALFQVERCCQGDGTRYAGVIREGLERIRRVVGQLVDLTRSGEIRREPAALPEVFQSASLFAKMALKRKGVRLESAGAVPDVAFPADRTKVHQVLLNLLLNAADAAGDGGTVRLEAGADEDAVWLAVEDSGPGVPSGDAERIFEPFFTTKPPGKGSGMGLAISRRIAEGHGGTLTVERGRTLPGARFVLRLPRTNPEGRE